MASDYVDDFLRDERESFKRKETAAKKFDSRLDNFRKSAQALRDAARQFEEAFPGMSRTMIADKLAMTGTEKNIAFDAKGRARRRTGRKENPACRTRTGNRRRIGSGDDRIRRSGGGRRARPEGRRRTRHLGRRTARMGVRQLLMIGRDARCD